MNHKYNYNQCHSYTFICLILFLALGILSNMHEVVATSDIDSSGKGHSSDDADLLDKGDFAEFFDFGTGAFAAILFVLSLIAYKTLKTKRILYVSIAFAIFAIHTIVSRLNLFIPDIESSLLELILSAMEFVALALFFVAIIRKESVKTKTINI